MDIPTPDQEHRNPPGGLETFASSLAILAPLCILLDLTTGHEIWSLFGLALVLIYLLICFPRIKLLPRILLIAAGFATIAHFMRGAGISDLASIAHKSAYLPALVIVLTLLRLAAGGSPLVGEAGQYVVRQPPNRRYALLASGGHVFGILLNIGGFLLLLDTALANRIAVGTPENVARIQTRRISTAIMRGFAATIIWSPLGLSLNLLLTLIPGITLLDYLPLGFAVSLAYVLLGWVFDRIQNPMPARGTPVPRGGRLGALLALFAILIAINLCALAIELIFHLPLRAANMLVVPLFAIGWVLLSRGTETRPAAAIVGLGRNFLAQMPVGVSEICVMASAGYLGLLIAALIPNEAAQELARYAQLENGALAASICLTILLTALVGINPLITSTILVTSIINAELAIAPALLIIAVQIGWALSLVVSPVTATVAIASAVTGQPASTVGLRWNGAFSMTLMVVSLAGFLIFG